METFQLLSRGGAKFDKKRFGKDVQLFSTTASKSSSTSDTGTSKALRALQTGEIPAELDFFKYASGGTSSGAAVKGKAKASDNGAEGGGEVGKLMATSGKKMEHEESGTTVLCVFPFVLFN